MEQADTSSFPNVLTDYIVCSVEQKNAIQPKLDPGIKDEPIFDEVDSRVYLFNIAVDKNDLYAAISTSLSQIKIYDIEKRSLKSSLTGHKDQITSVQFYDEFTIYSSSYDGSLIFWDIRSEKPQRVIQAKSSLFSSAAKDNTVSGGGHSFISNWDLRQDHKMIHSFNDSHSDDITHLKYHPLTNYLFSSSCDGLSCIFDVSLATEDDALLDVLNIGQSINKFGFAGAESEFLYALLHSEQIQLWDIRNSNLIHDYGFNIREILSNETQQQNEINYLIDCKYQPHLNELYLFGGSFDGKISAFSLKDDSIQYISTLQNGHSSVVRDIHVQLQLQQGGRVISIGEDSKMAFWETKGSFKGSNRKINEKKSKMYHPYQK